MGIINRTARKVGEKIGHSLTSKMGLNPSFFKAGAGSGEV